MRQRCSSTYFGNQPDYAAILRWGDWVHTPLLRIRIRKFVFVIVWKGRHSKELYVDFADQLLWRYFRGRPGLFTEMFATQLKYLLEKIPVMRLWERP
jgi:hypothetical protein